MLVKYFSYTKNDFGFHMMCVFKLKRNFGVIVPKLCSIIKHNFKTLIYQTLHLSTGFILSFGLQLKTRWKSTEFERVPRTLKINNKTY